MPAFAGLTGLRPPVGSSSRPVGISPGGMIVLDDYGWSDYRDKKDSGNEFVQSRGLRVLELPTGLGLVVKR
jgi:hypothetical protein